ncbi:F0F1 ATP synthase subunit B [Candidatus Uhrbacteria bacterium]|nr:F0F1 ATP synthase subunit B [Candidatus Uhrbacteria bacterium]
MEILSKLGIDWRLLIAQIVNFAILLALLYKFAYKPLLALLEKREAMIAKSVEDARAIEERLQQTEKSAQEVLMGARKEAAEIFEAAEHTAEQRRKQSLEKTKEDLRQIVEQTRMMLKNEKEAMVQEARAEIAHIVVRATERVLADVAHEKVNDSLVQKTLEKITG